MPDPVASLHRLGSYGVAVGTAVARSGLLGPYTPRQVLGVVQGLRRYGLTAGSVYAVSAALRGDAVAVVDDAGEATFIEMEHDSSTVAAALADMGIGTESRIGVLCCNHRAFLTAIVSLGKVGADTVYLNTGFAAPQLAEVLRREGTDALIVDQEFLGVVKQAGADMPIVVAWTDDPTSLGTTPSFDAILAGAGAASDGRLAPPAPGRIGRQIVLTSGTTGTPKGAQRNTNADPTPLVAMLSRIPLRREDVTLVAAPMFHAWGLAHAALGLSLGSTLVLARHFDPEETLRRIEAHRVRVLVAVPVMLQRIMQLPKEVRRSFDTSSLRVVALSGSAIPGDVAIRFMDEFGDVVYNLYGSTEAGWASIATPGDLRAAPGTAGRVPVGTSVRILNGDDRDAPRGLTGRIFVRNGAAFEGYTGGGGKPMVDGYLSTGDMGHFDGAGRLFVDGRDDDMVVSGGENVFPGEVEDLLASYPDVVDVAVVGVPDDEFGERLRAYVVMRPDAAAGPEDLREHVRSHLATYKVPREVIVTDEIPRNASGKILRRQLKTSDRARRT